MYARYAAIFRVFLTADDLDLWKLALHLLCVCKHLYQFWFFYVFWVTTPAGYGQTDRRTGKTARRVLRPIGRPHNNIHHTLRCNPKSRFHCQEPSRINAFQSQVFSIALWWPNFPSVNNCFVHRKLTKEIFCEGISVLRLWEIWTAIQLRVCFTYFTVGCVLSVGYLRFSLLRFYAYCYYYRYYSLPLLSVFMGNKCVYNFVTFNPTNYARCNNTIASMMGRQNVYHVMEICMQYATQ